MSSNNQYTANAMRRAFRILAALIALIGFGWSDGHAQVPLTGAGRGAPASGFTPSCAQSSAFLARATAVTLTADKQRYDNLICGLETNSIGCSTKFDAIWVLAAPDSATMLLNLCSSSFPLVQSGVCTFTANTGVACDGSTGHLATGFTPLTSGVFYTQNAASYGAYDRTNSGANDFMGARVGLDNADNFVSFGGGNANVRINESIGTVTTLGGTNFSGTWLFSRNGASATKLYHYGSDGLPTSATGSGASSATAGGNAFWIGCNNLDGSCNGPTTDQIAIAFVGGALNDTQAGNAQTLFNAFMTSNGTNVY